MHARGPGSAASGGGSAPDAATAPQRAGAARLPLTHPPHAPVWHRAPPSLPPPARSAPCAHGWPARPGGLSISEPWGATERWQARFPAATAQHGALWLGAGERRRCAGWIALCGRHAQRAQRAQRAHRLSISSCTNFSSLVTVMLGITTCRPRAGRRALVHLSLVGIAVGSQAYFAAGSYDGL